MFQATGALPDGFLQQQEPTPPPMPKPRRISKTQSKKVQKAKAAAQVWHQFACLRCELSLSRGIMKMQHLSAVHLMSAGYQGHHHIF